MSDEKKLPPEDKKTCEDVDDPFPELRVPWDQLIKAQESISKNTTPKQRQITSPYEGTLQFSTFSATQGLEIFPIPSPPPQIVQKQVFRQGCPRPSATTMDKLSRTPLQTVVRHCITLESAAASLNLAVDTPSLLSSHPGRRESAELTPNMGGLSLMPSQPVVTESSQEQLLPTIPIHTSMATLSLSPSQSVVDNGRSAPEGMELRIRTELEEYLKSIKDQGNIVPQTPSVSEHSNNAQIKVLKAVGQDGTSSGIHHSGIDDGKYAKPPQDGTVSVIQHSGMQNVQCTNSTKADQPNGVHLSGFEEKQDTKPTEDGKLNDMPNLLVDNEINAGEQQDSMMIESMDCSVRKALESSKDKLPTEQRPRR